MQLPVMIVATCLLAANAVFQVALALGAPYGRTAYGGRVAEPDGRLPTMYRRASAGTAVFMLLAIGLVLAAGGVLTAPVSDGVLAALCFVMAALMLLNTLGNMVAVTRTERLVMGSGTAVLAVCFSVLGLMVR